MAYSVSAQILVVAGGGGGGGSTGGGGGGGGVSTASISLLLGTHAVVVGAGGTGTTSGGTAGTNGVDSSYVTAALPSATTYLSKGGGAGGQSGSYIGQNGGSGGGGSLYATHQTAGTSNQTSLGYAFGLGNAGGTGGNYPSLSNGSGGGGGGAGAAGVAGNSISATTGDGGAGYYSTIGGTNSAYGGGGGGGTLATGSRAGNGGVGGGGAGIYGAVASTTSNATAYTGGGGGGDGTGNQGAGNGGSGVVIISYPTPQQFIGGTITTVSGNIIHTFTGSGSLSPTVSYSSTLSNQGDIVTPGSPIRSTSPMNFNQIPVYDTYTVKPYNIGISSLYGITPISTSRISTAQDAITTQISISVVLADQTMMLMNSDPTVVATWDNPMNYQSIQLVTPANDPRRITVRVLYYQVGSTGETIQTGSTSLVQTWF
jgi:hypothetical protein